MRNIFLFILLALLWSGSFLSIKITVTAFPPVFCAMMRVLIAFLCLSLFFILRKKTILVPVNQAWRLWIAGLFAQGIPFGLLFYGERFVSPGLASILNSTVTIWALLLGGIFFRDFSQWTFFKIIGVLLGFLGIIFIFYPIIHHGGSTVIGVVSILCMAISYGIGGLINQHLVFGKMKTGFETNLWQQHIASLILLLSFSYFIEPWPSVTALLNIKIISAFLYLGIMATAVAWMIYFYLLKSWDAVRAASVMYVVPILAILWDYLFLHLIPAWNEWIGVVTILLGVTLIQWRRKSKGC